jgi:cytochrome P450
MTIPDAEKELLHWMATNHDPLEFPDPDTNDLTRVPNRHLAFGIGIHRCLGMHLAKLQLRILFEEVFTRLPDFVVTEASVRRKEGLVRNVASLPVTFTPGTRRA